MPGPLAYTDDGGKRIFFGFVWKMFDYVVIDQKTGLAWPPTYNAARGVWQS